MPALTAKLSKHYDALSGAERFVAAIEAMARGDAASSPGGPTVARRGTGPRPCSRLHAEA
jgi:hypothetical protein